MQVRFDLTIGDLRMLRLHYLWRTPAMRRKILFGLFAGPAAVVGALFAFEPGVGFNPWIAVGLCGVALPAAIVVGCVLNAEQIARTQAAVDGTLGEHVLALTDSGVIDSDSAGSTVSDWSRIADVRLVAGFVMMIRQDGNLHAVPRRAFADAESARTFAERARQLRDAANKRLEQEATGPPLRSGPA